MRDKNETLKHAKLLPRVHRQSYSQIQRHRERKGSDTYTNCKLKAERQKEGKIQKIKVVTVKKTSERKLPNPGSQSSTT